MLKQIAVAGLSLVAVGLGTAAVGQDAGAGQGQQLYNNRCSACHMPAGEGNPPSFPTLAGNDELADLNLIVTNIHAGKGGMPAFPDLTAAEIAAIASYIRTSWGNDFGVVTEEDVSTILGQAPAEEGDDAAAAKSIWDGVFTAEQAERGAQVNAGSCASCHGRRMDGAALDPDMPSTPPIARNRFLRDWDGQSLAALFQYIRSTMPKNNPGSLSDQQYIDVIAEMLSASGAPVGDAELAPDTAALGSITIGEKPE